MSSQHPEPSPWGEPAGAHLGDYETSPASSVAGNGSSVAYGPVPAGAGSATAATLRPTVQRAAERAVYARRVQAKRADGPSLWRRVRATFGLAVIALSIGLALAATVSVVIWVIATAFHHAAAN